MLGIVVPRAAAPFASDERRDNAKDIHVVNLEKLTVLSTVPKSTNQPDAFDFFESS